MNLDDLTLRQLKELKAVACAPVIKKTKNEDLGTCIVILQRGWVMVGRLNKNGYNCELSNASVIRLWGTSKGLGEIALNGPTSNTKLDPCGLVKFHLMTTVATIHCEESKWQGRLS
jgi:hypothetical protein